jgi:hypothetical protein
MSNFQEVVIPKRFIQQLHICENPEREREREREREIHLAFHFHFYFSTIIFEEFPLFHPNI